MQLVDGSFQIESVDIKNEPNVDVVSDCSFHGSSRVSLKKYTNSWNQLDLAM